MGRRKAAPPAGAPAWAARLAASARGIRESRQRSAKIVQALQKRPAEEIALFLESTRREASDPRSPFRTLHLDLLRHRRLLAALGYDLLAETYRCAADRGWTEVALWLRSDARPSRAPEEIPGGYAARLRSLTLGERRNLGRREARGGLEMLLFDTDPGVIRELLSNPKLGEREVVRIAARHRAPPEILEEVCRSAWVRRPSVRKALVFNPATPLAYALELLRHLPAQDLRSLLAVGVKRRELREAASRRLGEKAGAGGSARA